MISRRLTKNQKDEIVEAYRAGENTNILAEKYSCSSNTINRTVKTLLSDSEYKSLKGKRLKSRNEKAQSINNISFDSKKDDFEQRNSLYSLQTSDDKKEESKKNDYNSEFEEIDFLPIGELDQNEDKSNQNSDLEKIKNTGNEFEEIVPLVSSFDFEKEKLDFEILSQETLPESVYMLVDKKVELEVTSISDLPEWSFLPENELRRNALLLFFNQRTAKRSCSRNQRVIKIPNTNVFKVSKPYLISKGITRLILEDSMIGLDN